MLLQACRRKAAVSQVLGQHSEVLGLQVMDVDDRVTVRVQAFHEVLDVLPALGGGAERGALVLVGTAAAVLADELVDGMQTPAEPPVGFRRASARS